jgi:hypothetical protein
MKTSRALLAALGLPLLLAGCFDADDAAPGGKIDGMTVNNEDGSDRLSSKNEALPLDSVPGASKRSASAKTLTLTLKAEIKSPVIGGDTLQATSVFLHGGFAYVSYNFQGGRFAGGVDVIQIKNESNAELRSQVLFDSNDVHALVYAQQTGALYLAEGDVNNGAMIEKLEVNGGKIVLQPRRRAQLGSFVATAVTAAGNKVWVTTGNTGRVYAFDADLNKTDSSAVLDDARWVDYDGARLVVGQGSPCRLQVYSTPTLLGATGVNYPVGGCGIPESKTTARSFALGKVLVAAGDSGVRIVSALNGARLGGAPRVKVAGLDSLRTVTNAADGSGTLIYASNGEAGVHALEASTSLSDAPAGSMTVTTLGKLRFANFQSANHVAFDGNTLVVAAGKGGVKIVAVDYK